MQQYRNTLAAASMAALLASTAMADANSVKSLPSEGPVTLTGTVDGVKDERTFTLRDNTGTIDVDIRSGQSVVLKQGDTVTVSGTVDKGLTGTDIADAEVTVHRTMAQALENAIESNPNVSLDGAQVRTVATLPKEGLVKVSGVVGDIDSEKKFTLKDATGSIKVEVDSPQTAAAVTEGAEVSVVGYVDSGLLGKDLKARKILVTSNADPVVNNNN